MPTLRQRIHRTHIRHGLLFSPLCFARTKEQEAGRKTQINKHRDQRTQTTRPSRQKLPLPIRCSQADANLTHHPLPIITIYSIPLHRFTDRTVRISREDLDKAARGQTTAFNTSTSEKDDILSNWMTREQIMKEFGLTLSWFTSTIKRHQIKPRIIGNRNFYKKDMMEAIFTRTDYSDTEQWYTFDQLRETTGMRTESICDFCKNHKIQRERKNGITYVSKRQWDNAKGNGVDTSQYITMKEITDTYKLSRNHLYTIFKENGIERIKIGNFVYFNREEVKNLLTNRK